MSLITKTKFAQKHGFSKQYVSELVRKGKIVPDSNGLLDEDEADYMLELNRSVTPSKKSDQNNINYLYAKSRLQNEIEKGKLLKLERAEKEQSLIPAEEVRKTLFTKGRVLRDALLNVPDRVSAELAGISDEKQIHKILTREITDCLEELSNE